ncbi:hypothetical protein GN956_G7307 [Arapaima gigas]
MPWLELLEKGKDYNCRPLPGFFCSHLQEYLVPRGLCNNKAKVIYIVRNPKDILASYHHFTKFILIVEKHKDMEETLENSCVDGVRWYKNCNKYKFLFLSYEQMIKERWQHGVVDRSLATDARGIRHHWGLEELLSSVPE